MRGVGLLLLVLAAALPSVGAEDQVNSGGVALRDVYKGTLMVSEQKYPFQGQIALGKMAGVSSSQVTVHLSLFGGVETLKSFVKRDGTFKFSDVPAGTHKLEVHAEGYDFSFYRVDISEKLNGRARVARVEAPTKPLGTPLILAPVAVAQKFQQRAHFSVWSILTNPFYMMMFLMAIMIFVVPKTMENMDPEERKAMQEQMANGGLLGSLLSGNFDADEMKKKMEEQGKKKEAAAGGSGSKKAN